MRNAEAVQKTVSAMRTGGLLEDVDEALIEALAGLAEAVDSDPSNASLWREYRGALSDLRSLRGDGDDDFTELLDLLRAPLRDGQEPRP